MSHRIGDYVKISLGPSHGLFRVIDIMPDGIYLSQDDPSQYSKIVETTQGWRVFMAEDVPYVITFLNLEPHLKGENPNVSERISQEFHRNQQEISDRIIPNEKYVKDVSDLQSSIIGKGENTKEIPQFEYNLKIGDTIRVSLGKVFNDYIVRSLSDDNIIIYLKSDPSKISMLIPTPEGLKVYMAETTPYNIVLLRDGVQPIPIQSDARRQQETTTQTPRGISGTTQQEVHTDDAIRDLSYGKIGLPSIVDSLYNIRTNVDNIYGPPSMIDKFDYNTVKTWLSLPEIKLNLIGYIKVSGFPFSSAFNYVEDIDIDSTHREETINYIIDTVLPNYVRYEGLRSQPNRALVDRYPEYDLTRALFRAISGSVIASDSDVYYIFEQIFTGLKIQKVADDGDCYYSAIGINTGQNAQDVRFDIAEKYLELPYGMKVGVLENAVSTCPPGRDYGLQYKTNFGGLLEEFSDVLTQTCGGGKVDCEGCIWGGNFLDTLVSQIHNRPVVSIIIIDEEDEDTQATIDEIVDNQKQYHTLIDILDKMDPSYWDSRTETLTFSTITRVIAITTTSEIGDEDELMERSDYIPYILSAGKHVDAIVQS